MIGNPDSLLVLGGEQLPQRQNRAYGRRYGKLRCKRSFACMQRQPYRAAVPYDTSRVDFGKVLYEIARNNDGSARTKRQPIAVRTDSYSLTVCVVEIEHSHAVRERENQHKRSGGKSNSSVGGFYDRVYARCKQDCTSP